MILLHIRPENSQTSIILPTTLPTIPERPKTAPTARSPEPEIIPTGGLKRSADDMEEADGPNAKRQKIEGQGAHDGEGEDMRMIDISDDEIEIL